MDGHIDRILAGAVCCEKGRHANNEDNYFLNGKYKKLEYANVPALEQCAPSALGVYAVCDGMGGMASGEEAAALAMSTLSQHMQTLLLADDGVEAARKLLDDMSAAIRKEAHRRRARMGAAVVLAVTCGSKVDLYNVGDCRAYLFQGGDIIQLSQDHTLAQSMRDMGLDGNRASIRHQLTQHLGMDEDEFTLKPHYCQTQLSPGSRLLLCSDGLTDMLADQQIAASLERLDSPVIQVQSLVTQALEAGGRDNITALVLAPLE